MKPTFTLFVGIDVSRDTNQRCALNFNQDVFFNQTFKNTPEEPNILVNKIVSVVNKKQLNPVLIVMESYNEMPFEDLVIFLNEKSRNRFTSSTIV